jgi:hypothetical protein
MCPQRPRHGATCSESTSDLSVPIDQFSCSCVAGFTNGVCNYAYNKALAIAQLCSIKTDATCSVDVDEWASNPRANGAASTDSLVNTSISVNAYRCTCLQGFSNCACGYQFISQYTAQCNVKESSSGSKGSGNCDVDVGECASSPCANKAVCTDSTKKPAVPVHMYQCACTAGHANGVCAYSYIRPYLKAYSVLTSAAGGNCDVHLAVRQAVYGQRKQRGEDAGQQLQHRRGRVFQQPVLERGDMLRLVDGHNGVHPHVPNAHAQRVMPTACAPTNLLRATRRSVLSRRAMTAQPSVATATLTWMNAPASRARTARPAYPHFLTFVRLAHTL